MFLPMQQARLLLSVVIDELIGSREATMSSQRDVQERDGRSAGHNTRKRMLADLPVTSDGRSWPASPPPCWRAETDRRCF
jgi:hypothetical protein